VAAKQEKLLDRFMLDRQRGYEYRQHFEQQWRDNWQGYMNKKPRPDIPNEYWTKRTRVPDYMRIIETILPQHMLGMFRDNNWFSVSSTGGPGRLYEQTVKQLLLGTWRRGDMFQKTISGLKYGLITGHSIMKTFWSVKIGPKEVISVDPLNTDFEGDNIIENMVRSTAEDVTFSGPQTYFPDLFNCVQDPTGRDMWFMERIPQSLEQLKYQNDQYDGALYDSRALGRVRSGRKTTQDPRSKGGIYSGGAWASAPFDTASLLEYVDGIPERRDVDEVDVWQWWAWIPPEVYRYDDTQWRLIVVVNDQEIIRDVPAPTPDRQHPYDNIPAVPIPGRIYGESVLTWVGDLIDLRQFIEDARREETLQKLWEKMIISEEATLSPDDLFNRPGGVLWVGNHLGSLKDAVMPVPARDVLPSSYSESSIKEDQIMRATGATDPFQGAPAGGRTTATEISIVAQLGSGRFQLATMWFDEKLKRKKLERDFKLLQSRLEQREVIELSGTPPDVLSIDMTDLLWDVDIHVDSGLFGSLDQQMLQSYLQLYQIFASNPEANQYLRHGDVIHDAFVRAGDPHVDRHVRSDDEVARERQALMEQQQALAEQQAATQAGLDTNRELARGFASTVGGGGGEGGAA
jgi:hypothetical protein